MQTHSLALTVPFEEIALDDVSSVGGKNASLGELIANLTSLGIKVPTGFATTAAAYWQWLDETGLRGRMARELASLEKGAPVSTVGKKVRRLVMRTPLSPTLSRAISDGYKRLARESGTSAPSVAVRSSATAEDLPEASFAGQQESFLNVRGKANLLKACHRCFASLFTDRAIVYRENHGFDHMSVALSVGVQHMVRADKGSAGVMFSLDTESGFRDVVLISANWGLGETVVQGNVTPDEYVVFKPLLGKPGMSPIIDTTVGQKQKKMVFSTTGNRPTRVVPTSNRERREPVLDEPSVLRLAEWACDIERHYAKPMDMEWARDGKTGELYIVQARPETVQSAQSADTLRTFKLHGHGKELTRGQSIGNGVAVGRVNRLDDIADIDRFQEAGILVTRRTNPDWVPAMRRAAAIVTDHGGRTSHAAIVSRELGVPAVIGTETATRALQEGAEVTVSCAEGTDGFVYAGRAEIDAVDIDLTQLPKTRTGIMLNLANPAAAFRWWRLPTDGIGLVRMEFIVNNHIKVHPMALVQPERVADKRVAKALDRLTENWPDPPSYFVDKLANGLARIAASQFPNPVIVRMSDFKTNEYAHLLGGAAFEPIEENPMLGWRGASRYYSDGYRQGFALECQAVKRVREEMGLSNLVVMIPFCRTPEEADRVLDTMAEHGLVRGTNGLEVYVMAEIPANVILASEFAARFDGFSIGSNDLTQLVLGVDRDSQDLTELFDDQHPAVKKMIGDLIETAHEHGRKVGLCGEAPSNHPEFARFLVERGIDTISVNPDSFVPVKNAVFAAEQQ
jgi:pyruvate,water dikinase